MANTQPLRSAFVIMVLCVSGCRDRKSASTFSHDTTAIRTARSDTGPVNRMRTALETPWPITADSVGPIHFGMTLTELANERYLIPLHDFVAQTHQRALNFRRRHDFSFFANVH